MLVPLHGLGTRHDLPLPFSLVVIAAAVVLVATFWLLVRAWRRPRFTQPGGIALPRLTAVVDAAPARWGARIASLLVFGVAALALVAGPDKVQNPALGYIYVWVWVGLVPASLLFGRVVRALSPVHALLAWRGTGDAERRFGLWPGAVALLAFVWLELAQPDRATTHVLRWWALAWLVWCVGGALAFGRSWLSVADPFEVFSDAAARLSPWQRRDGVQHLTNPLRHLGTSPTPRGLGAVACVLLASTSFDAFSSGSWFVQHMQVSDAPPVAWASVGLVVVLAVVVVTYVAACWLMRLPPGLMDAVDQLAVGLLPIAVGYSLAHYWTFLELQGQQTLVYFSDPLGLGQNWFGTAEIGINTWILAHPTMIAWLQVGFIVAGHVVGVIAAHDKALALLPRERQLVGQLPMLVVMVAYTCTGLVLLFGT